MSDEALNAAVAIGDDRIQQQMRGRVVPEAFTHGSSEQRRRWLKRGLDSGQPRDCGHVRCGVKLGLVVSWITSSARTSSPVSRYIAGVVAKRWQGL
jgi:hypothetical protein